MGLFFVILAMATILGLTLMARKQLHLRLLALEDHHRRNPWLQIQAELECPSTMTPALKGIRRA